MKKLIVLAILTSSLLVVACGSKNDVQENTPSTTPSTTQEEEIITDEGIIVEDVTATELIEAVKEELGENYWPSMDIPSDYITGTIGIDERLYEEVAGQMPMISTNVDMILIAKATDGNLDALKSAIESYRETLIADSVQYPMNVGKVQASKIETIGDYVVFVQLGGSSIDLETEEEVIKACEEENNKAINVIESKLVK
ncbi:MAG: DUF4358 domain-containing protein [Lachnospiraceae bacterium]